MKQALVAAALVAAGFAVSTATLAADEHHHGHGNGSAEAADCCKAPATHQATGIVKRVDPAKGTVTLQHDPIASLGWPRMTMAFKVLDEHILAGLKPEAKVAFRIEKVGSDYVITSVQ